MSVRMLSGFKATTNSITDSTAIFVAAPSTAALATSRGSIFGNTASALKNFAVSIGQLSPPKDQSSVRKYALWGGK